jgi:hypothetical protein
LGSATSIQSGFVDPGTNTKAQRVLQVANVLFLANLSVTAIMWYLSGTNMWQDFAWNLFLNTMLLMTAITGVLPCEVRVYFRAYARCACQASRKTIRCYAVVSLI